MINEPALTQTPQAAARTLGISVATLRRWSEEFAEYLSGEAQASDGKSQRRYTRVDLDRLALIKTLLDQGLPFEQAWQQVAERLASPGEAGEAQYSSDNGSSETALMAASEAESPAIAFLTNTLMTLSDTQKSILNSQAANRELLGVLIQDNFNLKEENNRLRERILEVERTAAQSRQEEEWRRDMLRQEIESKLATVQQLATEALTTASSLEMPEVKAVETRPGCLGALLGQRGHTQIFTIPRRHPRQPQESHPQPASPAPLTSSFQPPLSQPPPAHPKPTAPPE